MTIAAETTEIISLGKIVAAHGLRGCMKLRTTINNAELLETVASVWLGESFEEAQECEVSELNLKGKTLYLTIAEVADRNEAEQAIGLDVFARRSDLKPLAENEWWVRDLVGLHVFTTGGDRVGTICDVVGETGELLEIEKITGKPGETILVPFVKALVPIVDVTGGRVEVVALPGLLD